MLYKASANDVSGLISVDHMITVINSVSRWC